jgi:protein-disulfide isomerase
MPARSSSFSFAARLITLIFLLAAISCVALGCAGTTQKPAEKPSAASAENDGKLGPECQHFASALCDALGSDSEDCASLRNVGQWLPPKACTAAAADLPVALARVNQLRKDCDALAQKLCAELGDKTATCAEITRDMPQVPAGRCKPLLAHYPEIVAQMRERQTRSQPVSDEQWRSLLVGAPPASGAESAKVTIVEFSDFQCPYCAQASATVKQLRDTYGDKVRIVFHQFPLPFHDNARNAAAASLAAHAQGKFWALHDVLFEHQGALDRASLERYAAQAGLDVTAFKQALDAGSYNAQIDAELALGRTLHVDGTPTMFLNGKRVENPIDFDEVAPLVDAALGTK